MDFSADEVAFRGEVRDWLESHVPKQKRPLDGEEMAAFDRSWQREQFDGGWAGIAWPRDYGGCGLGTIKQLIWYEEYARAGAPYVGVNFVGLNHGGPTLIHVADEAQKTRHLAPILRGESVWCQGFSEPGSGSDLASLKTRAEIDGDELVVNGSKIWTSWAQWADFQELMVRTEPGSSRHAGLSWLICDMKSPGITIRPIMTMTGGTEFCEVFYDNVRVPLANAVGGVNNGWKTAMTTLSFERGTAFLAEQMEMAIHVEELIDLARERTDHRGRPVLQDEGIAARLATTRAEVNALRAMTLAGVSRNERVGKPGPEGSMIRLYLAEISQRMHALAMDVLGQDAMVLAPDMTGWGRPYLHSFAQTIGGGTAEIQCNIIGERVLGLPKGR